MTPTRSRRPIALLDQAVIDVAPDDGEPRPVVLSQSEASEGHL